MKIRHTLSTLSVVTILASLAYADGWAICDSTGRPSRCGLETQAGDGGKKTSDPINLSSGDFQHTQSDLVIPGRGLDFELNRFYRSYSGIETRRIAEAGFPPPQLVGNVGGNAANIFDLDKIYPLGQNWDFNYNMRVSVNKPDFDALVIDPNAIVDPLIPDEHAVSHIDVLTGTGRIERFDEYYPDSSSADISTLNPALYSNDLYKWQVIYESGNLPIQIVDENMITYTFYTVYHSVHGISSTHSVANYAGRLKSVTDRNGNQIQFFYETTASGYDRIDYAIDTLNHTIDFRYHDESFNSQVSPLIAQGIGLDVREQLIWIVEDHAERAYQYNYSFGSGFPMLASVTLPAIEDSSDFPLPNEQERFPAGSERKWEYAYDDDPDLYFWWEGRMLTTITSPNGDVIVQNEYMKAGEFGHDFGSDYTRNDARVVRQQYGNAAYNYVVTDLMGSIDVGENGSTDDDYYVWVNDRRGAITRFLYAGDSSLVVPTPRHRQLLEKTEFEGIADNADQSMYQDQSGAWFVFDHLTDTGSPTTGPKLPNGSFATATYTQEYDANENWNFDGFTKANDDTVSITFDTLSDDPRRWGAVLDRTISSANSTESITESWQYDFDFGGSGGCGCGSQGFETAYRDGKGYVTYKVYDTDINVVTGRAKGDLKAIYEDLPVSSTMDPGVTYAENNAASIDLYTYNDHGQVLTHTHPKKVILNSSGDPVPHNRVDQYVYYSDVNDSENYGRLHEMHVDVNGFNLITAYVYDAIGNMIKMTEPDGDVSVFVYNQAAQMVQSQRLDDDPDTNPSAVLFAQTDYFYDANGNLVKEEVMDLDGDQQLVGSIITINEYDSLDYLVTSSQEAGVFTGLILEEVGGSGRFIAPVTEDDFVTQKWIYDGGKNLIEFQNGEAVHGIGLNQTENIVEYEYDARDLLITKVQGGISSSALITVYEYDENGRRLRTIVDPDSTLQTQTTEVVYDAFNRVVLRTDPKGNQYQYEYNDNHNPVSIEVLGPVVDDADGSSGNVVLAEVSRAYGVLDLRESQSVELFDYDYILPGASNASTGQQVTSYEYNDDSSVRKITSPAGNGMTFEQNLFYDTASRVLVQEDTAGNITEYEYDVDSNVTKVMRTDISSIDGAFDLFEVEYEYDAIDRRIAIIDGVGNRTEIEYDSRSNVVKQEDARNNISAFTYDSLSRQLTTSLGNGSVTTLKSYDASNRLVSETDANDNTTVYEYDALNRLAKIIMPDGEFYQAQYDANGNMSQYTDARGVVIDQTFDLNNRLLTRDLNASGTQVPGMTEEDYTYDGLGRLRTAQNDFSKITREYDSRSNIVRELQNIDAAGNFPAASDREVAYEFDLANNTTKLSYPGGRDVYRTFDELNRMAGIFNDDLFADPITEFEYIGRRLQRREHGNGTRTDYTYNGIKDGLDSVTNASGDFGFGRVAEISTTKVSSSTVLDEFAFAWDKTQNRTVYNDIGSGMKNRRERSFGYDDANRLVSTDVDFPEPSTDFTSPTNNGITTYTLDGVYNRTDVSGFESNGAPVGTYSQTGDQAKNNQYTITPRADGGEWINFYDENGNLVTKYQTTIADFNGDFTVNFFDVSAFLAAYEANESSADINDDGIWNFFDVSGFLGANSALDNTQLEQWYYTYDFRNQLIEAKQIFGPDLPVNVGAKTTSTYDPASRRIIESIDLDDDGIADTAKQIIYGCASLWEVIEQIDIATDSTLTTHVYGLGIDDEVSYQYEEQGLLKDIWAHRDDLNSLTSITDSNGDVRERYEYGDYGKVAISDSAGVSLPLSNFNAQHLYTGRSMIAGTGLYDYRYRVMEPQTGGFNQRDPIGYAGGSMNLYAYTVSNPMRHTDPTGLSPESDKWNNSGYQDDLNNSLDYWLDFLGARETGGGDRTPISPECKEKLKCVLRAISSVESKHGTGTGNHPGEDPMQVGHPDDEAHKAISGNGSRGPVREGPLPGVRDYSDLPGRTDHPYPPGGHRDPDFGPDDSFFWGTIWYIMRTNQADQRNGRKAAWDFGDCSWDHLIDGAERYNGGGDAGYREKIKNELKESGCKDDDC